MIKVKILTSGPWVLIFISIHDENFVFQTRLLHPSCWQLVLLFLSLQRRLRREEGTARGSREDGDPGTGASSLERQLGLNRGARAALAEHRGPGYRQAGRQGALLSPERLSSRTETNQLALSPASLVRKGTLQAGGRLLSLWCDRSSCPGRDSVFLKRGCSKHQGLPLPPISSPSTRPLLMCWQSLRASKPSPSLPRCPGLVWR